MSLPSIPHRHRHPWHSAVVCLLALTGLAASPLRADDPPTPTLPLTLTDALRLAAERNEDAAIADARVARARATLDEAYATLLPSLDVSGTYTRRKSEVTRIVNGEELTIQARNALQGTVTVDTPLFDVQALPLVRSARRDLMAQELESRESRRSLAFSVAQTYYAVLTAERLRAAAGRRVEVAGATASEARLRLENGLAARNELTRSELERATAELAATRYGSQVTTARLALGYLLAEPLGDRPLLDPQLASPPPADEPALLATARASRQDLQALAARSAAADERAKAPRYGIFPDLALHGTYRGTNEGGLSGATEDWNVAAVLSWSLFDGGVRRARGAQLAAAAAESRLVAAARQREVDLDVRNALADLSTAEAASRQAAVASQVAEQNADEVRERFRVGLASALEQADANVAAFEAVAEQERAAFAQQLAQLALDRAVGAWPLGIQSSDPAVDSPPVKETP
jgi:outer membrane protein TolC